MDDLDLRPFGPGDADLVSSWAPTAREVWTWVSRRTVPVPPDAIRGWAGEDGSLTYLVHQDGEPVAYGQVWVDDDEDDAELARLLVAPAHRGRGVGRRMVAALTDEALKHRGSVTLRVAPGNDAALRCYAAAGFVRVTPEEEREWNQGQPVDFVWMRHAVPAEMGRWGETPPLPKDLTGLAAEIAAEAARLDATNRSGLHGSSWASNVWRFEKRFLRAARGENGPVDVETALAYLQADPWVHRSGYTAGKIARALAHQRLTPAQAEIAKTYVLRRGRYPRQGLLKHTALLGASVWDDDLAARFDELLADRDEGVRRTSRWLREAIELRRTVFGR